MFREAVDLIGCNKKWDAWDKQKGKSKEDAQA